MKFAGKLILNVRPVRRYSEPGYPSHADPDPLRGTGAPRYPWARGFAAMLAGLGLAAAAGADSMTLHATDESLPTAAQAGELAEAPMAATPTPTPRPTPTSVPDPNNPFSLQYAGLPHATSPYGTGVPDYMEREQALKAIERGFASGGIKLEANVAIKRGADEFIADGYDEESKIGFVFAHYNNLEGDAFRSWQDAHMEWMAESDIEKQKMKLKLMLNRVDDPAIQARAEAAMQSSDTDEVAAAMNECRAFIGQTRLSLEEAKACEARAAAGEDFIAVISQYDMRFTIPYYGGGIPSSLDKLKLKAIKAMPDGKLKEAAFNSYYKQLQEEAAERAVTNLETAVREYIDWARQEGM